ncbi:MAG: 3-phosphoshikimate 1-carboxyvinyltransferase [Bacteroidota bacterium]
MEITLGPAKPIVGTFEVPGDKSISHRALLLASLADGVSSLQNLLDAQDPQSTIRCLRSLGVEITRRGDATEVHGRGLRGLQKPSKTLDAGNSGTTMRLLCGVLAGQPFETTISGDESLRNRPMQRVSDPLNRMGAIFHSQNGKPPLTIRGKYPLAPITYTPAVSSAQVKSAVLLAGLFADGVTVVTENVVTRDHTERLMKLPVQDSKAGRTISVSGGTVISPFNIVIPGDISSAVFLICAAALVPGSDILIRNVGLNPTRSAVLDILVAAGLQLTVDKTSGDALEEYGTIHVTFGPANKSIHLDKSIVPLVIDEIPALAILAAASGVECSVRGAAELRVKESDRIRLLVTNLRSIGVSADEAEDGFSFDVSQIKPGRVQSGGDHRIAMAFALAGLYKGSEITIGGADASDVSFPNFWGVLESFQKR